MCSLVYGYFDIRGIITLLQGEKERDQCYKPILEELDALFPNRSKERYNLSSNLLFWTQSYDTLQKLRAFFLSIDCEDNIIFQCGMEMHFVLLVQ